MDFASLKIKLLNTNCYDLPLSKISLTTLQFYSICFFKFFSMMYFTLLQKNVEKKPIEFFNVIATISSQYSHKGQNILNQYLAKITFI